MFVKYVFFTLHTLLIMVCLADVYKHQVFITLLQYIAILSWHFNNNNCVITQLEDYYFNDTLLNVYNRVRGFAPVHSSLYCVPTYQRYTIYVLFTIRCCEITYSIMWKI